LRGIRPPGMFPADGTGSAEGGRAVAVLEIRNGADRDVLARMIAFEQLQQMFHRIAEGPGWDLSRPMRWGFFFVDNSTERLERAVPIFESRGYRFVAIEQPEPGQPPKAGFCLHVEREEVHTPESLHARNAQLEDLADELGLDGYHGMDVSPIG
jgi:Regulator of ribonuclease activity B